MSLCIANAMTSDTFVFASYFALSDYIVYGFDLKFDSAEFNDVVDLDFIFLIDIVVNNGFNDQIHAFCHVVRI